MKQKALQSLMRRSIVDVEYSSLLGQLVERYSYSGTLGYCINVRGKGGVIQTKSLELSVKFALEAIYNYAN